MLEYIRNIMRAIYFIISPVYITVKSPILSNKLTGLVPFSSQFPIIAIGVQW